MPSKTRNSRQSHNFHGTPAEVTVRGHGPRKGYFHHFKGLYWVKQNGSNPLKNSLKYDPVFMSAIQPRMSGLPDTVQTRADRVSTPSPSKPTTPSGTSAGRSRLAEKDEFEPPKPHRSTIFKTTQGTSEKQSV
jgi:hypothetical protein